MVAIRTKSRYERRALLRGIIDHFITLWACNDTQLEKLPIYRIRCIYLDTCDYIKWLRLEEEPEKTKEILKNVSELFKNPVFKGNDLHRDSNGSYICVFDDDGATTKSKKIK